MSLFSLADILARGGTIALLALWCRLLLRDHRGALAARLAVAMSAGIVAHVLATIRDDPFPLAINIAADMVSVTTAALFWLFSRAWFADERRIPPLAWLSVPWLLALVATLHARGFGVPEIALASSVALRTSMIAFALAGIWIAWRGRDDDLVETRRRLRWRLTAAIGTFVIAVVGIEILVQLGVLPGIARSVIEFGVTALSFAACAAMFGTRQPDLYGPPRRAATTAPAAEHDPLIARLRSFMDTERPYRDEGLTIAALAARLGEPEYRLRRAINGGLGHRNFPQFLNGYRLAEVRAALADPAQREVPILTIALDAGFGSLGPFNRAFREAEGVTPSAWRERALADSGIG